jgi:hypothetical protein
MALHFQLSIEIWVITMVDVRLQLEWVPVTVVLYVQPAKGEKTTI